MTPESQNWRGFIAGTTALAVIYVFFLLFAQFAFLALARVVAPGAADLRPLMAAQAVSGIAGSVVAALVFGTARLRRLLAVGLLFCGLGVFAALLADSKPAFVVAAAAIGGGLGFTTVTLVSGLRGLLGGRRIGLAAGLGTGVAYAFCNLPGVFTATAGRQAGIALAVLGAGVIATVCFPAVRAEPAVATSNYEPRGLAAWTAVFLALVWLDSTAFYIMQNTPALKVAAWTGTGRLAAGAVVHLLAALLAGFAFDRGKLDPIVAAAYALLAAGCLLLGRTDGAQLIYVAGVSFYSAALVYYPARGARPWIPAIVYAVSGWGGSALGIGMAQKLNAVPAWSVAAAGVIVVGALTLHRRGRAPNFFDCGFHG